MSTGNEVEVTVTTGDDDALEQLESLEPLEVADDMADLFNEKRELADLLAYFIPGPFEDGAGLFTCWECERSTSYMPIDHAPGCKYARAVELIDAHRS